ncbi:hypothetical protein P691DRAFT_785634 [Macrolepiota fuliginosa MF-IS2]|uniref:Uncharacterized protein n=1 Tax=Macrolepiota fuliginosa MF-IS2 TaxID=1400762 RepID=A0A9P5WVV2_9AGAR|nr:hypothetical protein P691DRAFT_785634 [Macrolepiota fuliginosa MF-IS2]
MEQSQTGGTNYNVHPQRVSQGMIVLNKVGAPHSSDEGDEQALPSEDENELIEVEVVESEYRSYSDKNDFLTTISDKPIEVLSDYGSDNEWNTKVPDEDMDIGNVDDQQLIEDQLHTMMGGSPEQTAEVCTCRVTLQKNKDKILQPQVPMNNK